MPKSEGAAAGTNDMVLGHLLGTQICFSNIANEKPSGV